MSSVGPCEKGKLCYNFHIDVKNPANSWFAGFFCPGIDQG
jgi:hypothetical protein